MFEAGIVSLEHRYYGKSSPFNSLTTENLKYLSSKQALFDLAAFRQYYQLNRTGKVDNPWFFFGASYSGALSAWFWLKFPHLTCGSLASSAVVRAVYDFPEYDQQIGESAGPECKAALQETNKLFELSLKVNKKAVKALFNATEPYQQNKMMKFSKLSGTSEAGAFRDVYGQRRNSPGQIELESFADPMRKEVTLVRKKIDSLDKELKPLGNTVQKKETEYKDALEAFNEKNKEKVELITKLQESSLPHEEAVVFVVSTTGQGDSPDSFKNSKSTL